MTNTIEIIEQTTAEKENTQHTYKIRGGGIDVVVESIRIDDQHVFEVMQGYTQECGMTAIDIPSTFVFDVVVSDTNVAEISVKYIAGDNDESNRLTKEQSTRSDNIKTTRAAKHLADSLKYLQRDATVGSDEGLFEGVENNRQSQDSEMDEQREMRRHPEHRHEDVEIPDPYGGLR